MTVCNDRCPLMHLNQLRKISLFTRFLARFVKISILLHLLLCNHQLYTLLQCEAMEEHAKGPCEEYGLFDSMTCATALFIGWIKRQWDSAIYIHGWQEYSVYKPMKYWCCINFYACYYSQDWLKKMRSDMNVYIFVN